ncbi:MAG: GDP-mannose 4,6-dehydratase [Proteobacteria bacterium]|nr:GDP-mannose 4,6-dehydratase [Pseudomonadota bacterium]
MKVLVTGASGFIGWKVSELLISKGYDVIGIDNLNTYYDVNLKKWRLEKLNGYINFKFYKVDIENIKDLEEVFQKEKPSGVINLAARAGVRYSTVNPFVYFSTNVMGTLNLLELMRRHEINKIVLASTSSLYAGKEIPYREDMATETPISPYAGSKKSAEMLLYTYNYLYGIKGVVLRYFTVYGPAGRPDMSYFRFIKLIDEGKPITLYGDGKQRRDFTYIDDIAKGTILAYEKGFPNFEIINLGNNKPVELIKVINLIEQNLKKKAIIDFKPFHKADMFETYADINKAEKILGWKPEVSIENGIAKCIDWYKSNIDMLSKLSLHEGDI